MIHSSPLLGMYSYDRTASRYKHWSRRERDRELGRLMDYLMDLDADGTPPPPKIQRLADKPGRLSEAEEDILLAWSESNTPGHYDPR